MRCALRRRSVGLARQRETSFFSRQTKLQKKTSDSRAADLNAVFGQLPAKIVDGHLRLGRHSQWSHHQGLHTIGTPRKRRRLVTAKGQRFDRPRQRCSNLITKLTLT